MINLKFIIGRRPQRGKVNWLSALGAFEIRECDRMRVINPSLKGQFMIGFVGKFTINLSLADHIGLGKSVSRGFGTSEKVLP